MKSKLVTSYYAYHNGEPFWGQPNRERFHWETYELEKGIYSFWKK